MQNLAELSLEHKKDIAYHQIKKDDNNIIFNKITNFTEEEIEYFIMSNEPAKYFIAKNSGKFRKLYNLPDISEIEYTNTDLADFDLPFTH
jgi:hypothetical protein